MKRKEKVLLAMSGGIDSSVSASLLVAQGFTVLGVYFRLIKDSQGEDCARSIAGQLGIGFYPVNLSGRFEAEVIDYFVSAYERGETPNPCVRCNKAVKFGELLRLADELGYDFVATGHYARISQKRQAPSLKFQINQKSKIKNPIYGRHVLSRGKDRKKDQSYFLYRLGQKELARILFPLGELTKDEVKRIAKEKGLPEFKGESQDICFLSKDGKTIDHNDFLKTRLKLKAGPIIDQAGKKLGEHQGLPLYTIGQRRGIEIGGTGPFYVMRADYGSNALFVTNDPADPALSAFEFFIQEANWVSGAEPDFPLACEAIVRYRGKASACVVERGEDGKYKVKLETPERAVTPGQSAVFYLDEDVIGGGVITLQ